MTVLKQAGDSNGSCTATVYHCPATAFKHQQVIHSNQFDRQRMAYCVEKVGFEALFAYSTPFGHPFHGHLATQSTPI